MEDQGQLGAEAHENEDGMVQAPAEAANSGPALIAVQPASVQAVSVANYQVPPPEKFSFKPEDWPRWIRRFERFRKATGLDQKHGANQVNTLIYSMGEEADDIVISLGLTADETEQYELVRNRFESHFVVKRNVIFERAKFNLRNQQDNESADSFITDLYCLAQYCEFGALKDELIRDRIVVGLADKKLSEHLQLKSNLTLQDAIAKARQSETIKKQQGILQGNKPEPPPASVERISKHEGQWAREQEQRRTPRPGKNTTERKSESKCSWCLGPRHQKQVCPARESNCNKCLKRGHWARACKSQPGTSVGAVSFSEEPYEGPFLGELAEMDAIQGGARQLWTAKIKVNGQLLDFKVDTGADVTVIPPSLYRNMKQKHPLTRTNKKLMGPCRHKLNCLGTFTAELQAHDKLTKEQIYVVQDLERPLLSREAADHLQLVTRVDNLSSEDYKAEMVREYPQLFKGLGTMKDSYTITLKEDAKPFAVSVPRKVPLPLYDQTRKELDKMLETGVISKVDQPTDWCAPMVIAPKSNGKVRVCVDLSRLNEYVKRENHPLPAVDTTLGKLGDSRVFTKLDANSGFWQIKLAWESRPLTTFITPWGRFCFNVLPFGISSGSEKFQKTMTRILEGLEGVECNIDDVLVHGRDQEEHDERLAAVLQRLTDAGVTLNLEKCVFSTTKVTFLGHVIGPNGVEADPEKLKAIADLPAPKNVQEVRTFLGMVNQLGKFSAHLAERTKSIRELLQKGNQWTWGREQQEAFEQIKADLKQPPILALYDPNKETKIAADASSYGLGGVVLQLQPDDTWRPVSFLSRAMTPTETRYAQIEKEALALTWACERSWEYIVGKSIYVETDHKPLVPLLSTHTLDQLPPRIQRFRMRLMRFHFKEIKHVPGKQMYVADALSRLQTQDQKIQPTIQDDEMTAHVASVISSLPASDMKLRQIMEAQEEDPVCREIKAYCYEGWPEKHTLRDATKPYWSERGELTVVQNILLKGSRLVIPSSMRLEILDKIHEGHQGITKCREKSKESVWWPGLSREIQDLVQQCRTCAEHRSNKPEPMIPTPLPDRPWQIVATDFFQLKSVDYLLVIDYFSRYVEVGIMAKNTTASETIRALKSIFARHGIPEQVRSDNGPQYDSAEFSHFAKEWGFQHTTSSPRFPQSNGEIERGVQTVKNLLKKEKDPTKGLLAYRSTPLACGFSPAQLLMGRKIRSSVPMFHTQLSPQWPNFNKLQAREAESKLKQQLTFNNKHRTTPLTQLESGAEVLVKDLKCPGVVVEAAKTPRSYVVETPTSTIRRNRVHLTPLPEEVKQTTTSPGSNVETPGQAEVPNDKTNSRVPPVTPMLASRPKRVIRPSLKVRENLGLT